jgi:hypothetical protein
MGNEITNRSSEVSPLAELTAKGLATLTAKEFATVVIRGLELWRHKAELAHAMDKLREDYSAMAKAQDAMLVDRDSDRALAGDIMTLMVKSGQPQQATEVFRTFLDKGPRFSLEVAQLIIQNRNEHF